MNTTLISQLRSLQALLAKRDSELKETKVKSLRLQSEVRKLQQRVKDLEAER